MLRRLTFVIITLSVSYIYAHSQPQIIDRVVAVVGKNTILQSEIEAQLLQMKAQGMSMGRESRCEILEDLLIQKLMINQALLDSIEVSPGDVEMQLNSRLQYFVRQIGSEQALEDYYNKTLLEIKEDLRDIIRDQMITSEMQAEITADVKVTPSEVRRYFNTIPPDSLPMINSQVEVRQIMIYPEYSETEKFEVKERLNNLRQRIINGEDFTTMAILYSQDPGSARRGGELGFVSRSDLVPEFANIAFSLREDRVSQVFETEFGFHIVQLIERRGDLVNCRHILMLPSASIEAKGKAKNHLDSIVNLIRNDSISFRIAAVRFSHHEESRISGGLTINPMTNSSRWELDQLSPSDYVAIKDIKVGELSQVFEARDDKGKPVYKLLYLESQTAPHQANLREDYDLIQNMALNSKRMNAILDWIEEKQKRTFVRIDESFQDCNFQSSGWLKSIADND